VGKRFNAVYRVYAWMWNHFWGTLFLVGGVWGLFSGLSVWVCLLSIGVGFYFYASGRFEAKVGAVAHKAATAVVSEVNREKNAAIDRDAATPDVMESSASMAEVVSALDAILNASWFDAYYGSGLRVSERAADKIAYTFRAPRVPRAAEVEVLLEAGDAGTHVVFKCLHQDESNGLRSYADLVAKLRESVEYAVAAAGDQAKVAEGVKLYGAPEKGSPAAIKVRNAKVAMSVGLFICLIPIVALKQGIYVRDFPGWIALELVGLGVAYTGRRWSKRLSTPRTVEALTASAPHLSPQMAQALEPILAQAPSPASTQAQEAAASAANAVKSGVGAARTWFTTLNAKQRVLIAAATVVVIFVAGIAIGRSGSGSDSANGSYDGTYQGDVNNPGGTGGDYTPPADTAVSADSASGDSATADGSTPTQVTNNAAPMSAAEAQAIVARASGPEDLLSTYAGTGLDTMDVQFESKVIDASHVLVFDNGNPDFPKLWAIPFDKVTEFYVNGTQCSSDEFFGTVVGGDVFPGTVGFSQSEVWDVDVNTIGE
jgi:hypothetical protein